VKGAIAGECTFEEYGKAKLVSLSIDLLCMGVGSYLSKGTSAATSAATTAAAEVGEQATKVVVKSMSKAAFKAAGVTVVKEFAK